MRRLRSTIYLLILFALLIAYAWIERIGIGTQEIRAANGERVDVRDGDTLLIGATKFRVYGIDAPELHQNCTDATGRSWPCGVAATDRLKALMAAPGAGCTPRARDRFAREIATCRTDAVPDIGRVMVSEGLAVAFGVGEESDYLGEEAAAEAAKRGLWQGHFERPRAWRDAHPRGEGN
ncbi:thermonuclease family protein [Sphingobium boeckii]|uniref:Endonuclease YncB(Thermonuclease family) n=1 Tax=Sphingobium boeckii TaxID=1082345 RepID=A0A7W9AIA1_9SPHN|nr:thermonuclease family protein [Sphingobium boeckii]MBB5686144.1 endonuclease YncB(thermonuclease family) [Sphingobium boeckii]